MMKEIKQITQPAFDERFYELDGVYYPSVTYILSWEKDSPQIKEWIGNKGYEEAQRIKTHAGDIGSYVHEAIEQMIKLGLVYTEEDIVNAWANPKDQLKVKRSLLGIMNFFEDAKPKVIEAEHTIVGQDYAGTIDLICTFPESKQPDKVFIVDFKTSKSLQESHKMQVEAYRRAQNVDMAACLQIGNTTKKRYTFSVTKQEDQDKYWNKFQAIKTMFQLDCPNASPTIEEFPEEFKIPLSK